MKNLLFVLLILAAGCAKQRPVEKFADGDKEILAKEPFLGKDGQGSRWLYQVTVVRSSMNGVPFHMGNQSQPKLGHFEFSQDSLRFIDDVTHQLPEGDSKVQPALNVWKIEHRDLKLDEVDGNVTNKEVEDKDKSWDQKRYFSMKFTEAKIAEAASFTRWERGMVDQCFKPQNSYLVDGPVEISSDYISFVVGVDYLMDANCSTFKRDLRNDQGGTMHFRYSFKRYEPTTYQPMVYSGFDDPDRKKFGFFETGVYSRAPRNGRFQVSIMANRWDPTKEHHYYFAKDYPEKYKSIFTDPVNGVFPVTNRMFAEKKLPIRFHIHENTWGDGKVKEFGDIRYSFIKLVQDQEDSGLLGYGPPTANPLTGEIFRANVVIFDADLKLIVENYRESEKREKSKFETSSLFSRMKEILKRDPQELVSFDLESSVGKLYRQVLPDLTFGVPGWGYSNLGKKSEAETGIPEISGINTKSWFKPQPESLVTTPLIEKAGRLAETHLNKMARLALDPNNSLIEPMEPAEDTLIEMLISGADEDEAMYAVLAHTSLHEFGHNLGLRHNFYGSVDQHNWGTPIPVVKNGKPVKIATSKVLGFTVDSKPAAWVSRTSSIMEYSDTKDEMHKDYNWQPYDIAALTFSYSGGKQRPTETFLYCSDEHTIFNALCNRFDSGTGPSEIVMNLIEQYEDRYYRANFRRDRTTWDASGSEEFAFGQMITMKKFLAAYEQSFSSDEIQNAWHRQTGEPSGKIRAEANSLQFEFRDALKLVLAFYSSVLDQPKSDRPWNSNYHAFFGELTRVGIAPDKFWAMFFLVGDHGLYNNLNNPHPYTSFLSLHEDSELRELIEDTHRYAVTIRVDMEPWFIHFGRALYARSASNSVNISRSELLDQLKISQFTQAELAEELGIDWRALEARSNAGQLSESERFVNSTTRVELSSRPADIHSQYFKAGEKVAVIRIDPYFYVVSLDRNRYSAELIDLIRSGRGRETYFKQDILELYKLYSQASGNVRR